MEEQILKFILSGYIQQKSEVDPDRRVAKEIASHVISFIEWFGRQCYLVNDFEYGIRMTNIRLLDESDAYQYWLLNIHNK